MNAEPVVTIPSKVSYVIFFDDGLEDYPIRCKITKIVQDHHGNLNYWLEEAPNEDYPAGVEGYERGARRDDFIEVERYEEKLRRAEREAEEEEKRVQAEKEAKAEERRKKKAAKEAEKLYKQEIKDLTKELLKGSTKAADKKRAKREAGRLARGSFGALDDVGLSLDGFGIGGVLQDRLKAGLITTDFKGHFYGYFEGWFARDLQSAFLGFDQDQEMLDAIRNRLLGRPEKRRAIFRGGMSSYDRKCNSCNQEVQFEFKGDKIVTTTKCPHPDGYPVYTARINVPSGKLIFGNDFRDLFDENASFDVNGTYGTMLTTKAYADQGMIHVYVGNTCPGVYKVSETRLNILSPEVNNVYAETGTEDDADPDHNLAAPPKGERQGGICTDLWWYSAMDYNLFKKLYKKKYGKAFKLAKGAWEFVVKVKPGCYKVFCQTHRVRDKDTHYDDKHYYCAEEMYSYIKRDGDVRKLKPQTPVGAAVKWCEKDFERYIQVQQMAWNSIFPTRQKVLEHMFLVIGNGLEWSNGRMISVSERCLDAIERYKKGERPSDAPSSDFYDFQRRMAKIKGEEFVEPHPSFYPISENYSAVFTVPDDVKPDWLAAVRSILHVVIANGTGPEDGERFKENKNNVKLAKKALKQLAKRFGPE